MAVIIYLHLSAGINYWEKRLKYSILKNFSMESEWED
jgi:hypothetical protein